MLSALKLTINEDATIIPGKVKAQISLRIVPNQDLEVIVASVVSFLKKTFDGFESPNKLQVCLLVIQTNGPLDFFPLRLMFNIQRTGGWAKSIMTLTLRPWRMLSQKSGIWNHCGYERVV